MINRPLSVDGDFLSLYGCELALAAILNVTFVDVKQTCRVASMMIHSSYSHVPLSMSAVALSLKLEDLAATYKISIREVYTSRFQLLQNLIPQ